MTQARRLLDDKRCGLAAIDGSTLLQKGFEIRRALETCIDAVFGDGWVDDQEVSDIARDRLARLGFMGGGVPASLPSMDAAEKFDGGRLTRR